MKDENEFIAKDLMCNFRPMSEEEQKDLLFILLDGMDFYMGKIKDEEAKSKPNEDKIVECEKLCSTYSYFTNFLLNFKELESVYSPREHAMRQARKMRLEYEGKIHKA